MILNVEKRTVLGRGEFERLNGILCAYFRPDIYGERMFFLSPQFSCHQLLLAKMDIVACDTP